MSKWRVVFIVILFISLVANAAFLHKYSSGGTILPQSANISHPGKYEVLDPGVSADESVRILNFIPLRDSLHILLDRLGESFGVYFEYLPTGTSININSNGEFPAASLFKLPVVIAYYLEKEEGNIKNKEVAIQKDQLDSKFGDLWKRGEGAKISLDDAARIAITDSDNTAIEVVGSHIDKETIKKVYSRIDIPYREDTNTTIITPRGYASILKALYFASILNEDDSALILKYLMETKFTDKLPAPIPRSVKVSHKIGVYNTMLFSDCGIVFLPSRHYLLCMVSASDEDTAREQMSEVSKRIYEYVSSYK